MQNDEFNDTLLVLTFKLTAQERQVGAAYFSSADRQILITEFSDNDHFSALESLIIQMNNSASNPTGDASTKFKVLINFPTDYYKHKLEDVVKMCEVDFVAGNKKDFSAANI